MCGEEAQENTGLHITKMRCIGDHVLFLMKFLGSFLMDLIVFIFIGAVSWQNGVLIIPLH